MREDDVILLGVLAIFVAMVIGVIIREGLWRED